MLFSFNQIAKEIKLFLYILYIHQKK